MFPSARLKCSAVFFSVFWTIGMVCWDRSYSEANIIMTVMAGALAAYFWCRIMRRQIPRGRVPARPR
ncbi:hypothetical protein [Bradyrhizobium canariense]|uniref:Uncharacterized protein n=1 Tax=Bradyrhizobium canariense TaxID=255045 RepID=A0A1H1W3H3_9BRAD|nr:hypothetical protein [Bradyrhizobium canariense]SDS91046.1 hypothetical protein SAMN05444158_3652 [Bradyrhizobium canariense]